MGLSAAALAFSGAWAAASLSSMKKAADESTADNYYFHIPGILPVPDTKDEENYGWGGNMNVEGPDGDKNFCNTFEGATLTFKSVHVHEAGAYKVMLPLDWATANQAAVKIEVTDAESNVLEASGDVVSPRNNFAWEKLEYTLDGVIADGVKNIKFSFTPCTDRN